MRHIFISFVLLLTFSASIGYSCPLVTTSIGTQPLIDFNCDQRARYFFGGDSITKGIGDPELNNENGGWPLDLEDWFPHAEIVNLGSPGADSRFYNHTLRKNIKKGKDLTTSRMGDNDVVVLMLGTNDYWNREIYPASKVPNFIIRTQKFISKYYTEDLGLPAPHMVVATLPPTKRAFQNPYIAEVNKYLLLRKKKLNVLLRFDKFTERIIGIDSLHPNRRGYAKMAKSAAKVLAGPVQKQMKKKRKDKDSDGIYDLFETTTYGTDSSLADTDGDSVIDGVEVFTNQTNALDSSDF